MTTMRTYGDGCAIAHGLDLVGERWALLVVRELLLGPKRYTDLHKGLPNASPNVLYERLRELERAGIVRRRKLPPPAGSRVYELTDWGRELEQTLISLGRWAARSPTRPSDAPIVSADSIILALRSLFDPGAAHGLRAGYELRLGEDRFRIEVADDEIEVARAGAEQADATIETDPGTLDTVLWGGRSLADAQRSGTLTIEGDAAAVERFVRLFPMPEPVAAVGPA
ncbi:MAG TPA: winged helix-turn-helix transcriptional regulator [Solirubrobacteraceae bacterium]|nr:winged helix-turn-helix transcriptional regulator [Solirubrobacteraceae bacterium]